MISWSEIIHVIDLQRQASSIIYDQKCTTLSKVIAVFIRLNAAAFTKF